MLLNHPKDSSDWGYSGSEEPTDIFKKSFRSIPTFIILVEADVFLRELNLCIA